MKVLWFTWQVVKRLLLLAIIIAGVMGIMVWRSLGGTRRMVGTFHPRL